ncbi:MAG: tellurite resistance TerB family protein, partial [Pseudomonadota bacterium]
QAAPSAPPPPPPAGSRFLPPPAAQEDRARVLVRAMISAAKADGHIDAQERQRITGQLDALGLDAPDRDFVFDELTKPLDVGAVAAGADGPEAAAEIYAASLLCIDVDSPHERRYLDDLAARMGVAPDLARHIEANAAAA